MKNRAKREQKHPRQRQTKTRLSRGITKKKIQTAQKQDPQAAQPVKTHGKQEKT